MKSRVILSSLLILSLIGNSNAEYIIKINVADSVSKIVSNEVWGIPYAEMTDWLTQDGIYNCRELEIDASTIPIGIIFENNRECEQIQKRTITTYEKSNKDNIRVVGLPIEEMKTINIIENIEDVGLRFNNLLTVGSYFYFGSNQHFGYFSDDYISRYGPQEYVKGDLSVKSYKGYTIDHLVYIGGSLLFRLLPAHSDIGMYPKITINGIKCDLASPDIYSSYNAICNVDLNLHIGSVLKIDIE